MKRFLIYALIVGSLGYMAMSSAQANVSHNSVAVKLAQLGE